jgi:hypothetical protein
MRIVVSNCSCDWCEEAFEFDGERDDELELDEALERSGWLYMHRDGKDLDFCSDACCVRYLQ